MPTPAQALALAIACGLGLNPNPVRAAAGKDWSVYLGDKAASHYSSLKEITAANVSGLQLAWTWSGGDKRPDSSQIQCNPLVIDGVVYCTSAAMKLVALDARTGRELWRFVPEEANGVNRGLATWTDGKERRILYGNGHWLYAVDAKTGLSIASFGEAGRIDLSHDLGRDVTGLAIQANTPGVVYKDLIILSMRVGEGPAPAAPGHVRAFDVRTGKMVWIFHGMPYPGDAGYETWAPDAWKQLGLSLIHI